MRGFNEAWLDVYVAKWIIVPRDLPNRIEFVLPHAFKSLNEVQRMHWAARKQYADDIAEDVALATRHVGIGAPMQRAKVTITRFGMKVLDLDNAFGGAKFLIDSLLVRSATHPLGMGFIVDDSPDHMDLIVTSEKAGKRASVRTNVVIERLV